MLVLLRVFSNPFTKVLLAGAGVGALIGAVFFYGGYVERKNTQIENLTQAVKAYERINAVVPVVGRSDALKWLSDNGQLR
jgi:hypothetical protein